ncbi:T9SS type A sorting domain-containing protein [Spirosoma sp. KNUC1025]|uniref:T9SS type A sorting domain-containing protein n=1 Tax=Spirosoma sp. KNUC1025 TaxID=2894082 RepID=UPI003869EBB8|nr:hypothetical protein LN737_09540 [Spirosoma sp. KNUC1025]
MKTLIKSLFVAFSLSLVTFSVSVADNNNPIGRPAGVASYKTGIYASLDGKLNIALDKESTGAVDVYLKNSTGKVVYLRRIGKKAKTSRMRLDMSELSDGVYQLEITNGLEVVTHTVTLLSQRPSTPSRSVALN